MLGLPLDACRAKTEIRSVQAQPGQSTMTQATPLRILKEMKRGTARLYFS